MTDTGSVTSMFSLDSQVAFITGAASGIGAGTAELFAAAGADLALAWYPPDGHPIEPVAARAAALGARVRTFELDVRDSRQVDAAVAQTVAELGSLRSWSPTRPSPGLRRRRRACRSQPRTS